MVFCPLEKYECDLRCAKREAKGEIEGKGSKREMQERDSRGNCSSGGTVCENEEGGEA